MNLRPLNNDDLKVTKGWADSKSRIRVFVSLKGASFVNKTYWLREEELPMPQTLDRIKTDLAELLALRASAISRYSTMARGGLTT